MTSLTAPDPSTEIGSALEVALAACDAADAISLGSFRETIGVETKADASFVTEADTAVERAIRERISQRFPDHGFVGEEYGEAVSEGGRRWIIDPIDGTHNYMRGVPIYATLLALEVEGELAVGVVSAPALHRRWFSWAGGGAWAADTVAGGWDRESARSISVSDNDRLDQAALVLVDGRWRLGGRYRRWWLGSSLRTSHLRLRRRPARSGVAGLLLAAQHHQVGHGKWLHRPPGQGLARPWPGRLLWLHARG
jgi:histidinol-phosphatase